MVRLTWMAPLAVAAILSALATTSAARPWVYVLNGYSFGGMPGVNTAELEAKLPLKEGARVRQADVDAAQAIVAKELEARRIKGQLFTSLAEKKGRVWIIFDLQDPDHPTGHLGKTKFLKTQTFEGASAVSAGDLAAATGLKPGDPLWPEKLRAAEQAIVALYAKARPGPAPMVKAKMSTGPDSRTDLTWVIQEK